VSLRGKLVEKRQVREAKCVNNDCPHKCRKKFCENDRIRIFEQFWKLTDEEKGSYYSQYIAWLPTMKQHQEKGSKRQYSHKYYFENNGHDERVCASFFLKTLDISCKRVIYHFDHINDDKQPSRIPKNRLAISERLAVIAHINTYPKAGLQCCVNGSGLKYFKAQMNCTKMHREYCEKNSNPVKYAMFVNIFKENFMNHRFLKRKQTVCDQCTQYKLSFQN
jgi:hypothetical protein